MKKRKEVQMMVKRIIVLLIALLALCSMAFALPAGIDNSANLVQIAGLGPDKLEGTSLAELKWFVDKTTMQSNLTGDKQRSTGYEATVTLVAMAKMNDGKISLLSEKWYIKTGGKEEEKPVVEKPKEDKPQQPKYGGGFDDRDDDIPF